MKLSTAVASILVLASWIPFGSAYPNPSDTVRVSVPAGPLVDAVELLARQARINPGGYSDDEFDSMRGQQERMNLGPQS